MPKIEVDVTTPRTPNFVKVADKWIDVADLSESVLRDIAREWTEDLVKRAFDRKVQRQVDNY